MVRRGPALEALGPQREIINGLLIDDVFDPENPDTLSPMRGFTRPSMQWYADMGYVLLACVCPDYRPGSVNLLPAILTSATGEPGSWTYHGILRGDVEEAVAARRICSDGGTLVRMPDDSWRVYLNGFGTVMAMLESESLDGPWRFLRTAEGAIRELLPAFPKSSRRRGCFPALLRVSDSEWHVWIVDTWPPRGVFHYWSVDGLDWHHYGEQPEITAAAIEGDGIKCLRPARSADGADILGLLSVWQADEQGDFAWRLHVGSMPTGPPPD